MLIQFYTRKNIIRLAACLGPSGCHLDLEELEDYEEREREVTIQKVERLHSEPASILDFYPRLTGDEHHLFKVNAPYTRSGAPYAKIQDLLPFFETQIVFIRPIGDPHGDQYENERLFREHYGVTVRQLLDLARDHKVAPSLSYHPTKYDGLDDLAPIFERKPPTVERSLAFTRYANPLFDEHFEEGKRVFQKLRKSIPRYLKGVGSEYKVDMSALTYAEFKSLAPVRFFSEISPQRTSIDFSAMVMDLSFKFHNAPMYKSLEGEHVVFSKELLSYDPGRLRERIAELRRKGNPWVFPAELARILVNRLEMFRFRSQDQAIEFFGDYRRARKALGELDKVLEIEAYQRYGDDLVDTLRYKADEAERIFSEVKEGVDTARHHVQSIRRTVAIGGSILGGALLPPPFNALSSLLALLELPHLKRTMEHVDYGLTRLRFRKKKIAHLLLLELDQAIHRGKGWAPQGPEPRNANGFGETDSGHTILLKVAIDVPAGSLLS